MQTKISKIQNSICLQILEHKLNSKFPPPLNAFRDPCITSLMRRNIPDNLDQRRQKKFLSLGALSNRPPTLYV